MDVAIINVGNEVVEGDVLNSNAQFLSKKIYDIGHRILFHSICRDNEKDIKLLFEIFSEKADIIIITGGLGPTKDDMTKEVFSSFMNLVLEQNDDVLNDIKEKFRKFNRDMASNNIKQSFVIKDARILFNEKGTAPGFLYEKGNKSYILLPGPPREMEYLFNKYIDEFLNLKISNKIKSQVIKVTGLGESYIESKISDLIENSNVYVATYASLGEVRIKISTNKNESFLDEVRNSIISRFRENIVSFSDEETSKMVCKFLIDNDISITAAESCTGGLLSSKIVENSGVSKIFNGSFITYSDDMKINVLNVKKETLKEFGAVSYEVVNEMLTGLNDKMNTDIAIAITGVAGPNGGSVEKPVGLVYIGIKIFDNIYIIRNNFRGNRTEIRIRTCKKVFNFISQKIVIDNLL
ncbi:MAG: competence/damage-inducible protein A [Bacillota bacterium]|nr:competence/damage-inducible protein A [Bacillota bacterium]